MPQRTTRSTKTQTLSPVPPLLVAIGHGLYTWWSALPIVQQRGIGGAIGCFFSFLTILGFLPVATQTWLVWLSLPFRFLFGVVAFFIPICGLSVSSSILLEIFQQRRWLQRRWLWGTACAFVIVATEMHYMFGAPVGGKVGQFGSFLLAPLPAAATQFALIGGLCLDAIITLRITWQALEQMVYPFARKDATQMASSLLVTSPTPAGIDVAAIAPLPQVTVAQLAATPFASLPPLPPKPTENNEHANDVLHVPTFLRRSVPFATAATLPPLPAQPPGFPDYQLPPLPAKAEAPVVASALAETLPSRRIGAHTLLPVINHTTLSIVPVWALPPQHLLNTAPEARGTHALEHAERLAAIIERTLRSFMVDAEVRRSDISVGPTIIRFGIRPLERIRTDDKGRALTDSTGEPIITRTRVSRIMNLKDDIALVLEVKSLRMEAPVPERPYVGIEIPNMFSKMVTLGEILASKEFTAAVAKSKLAVALGRDVAGRVRIGDISRFPHVLIAGATGAGKSVCLNAFIASLIMHATPAEVRFVMIDPKMVELMLYAGIPHLLAPVVTDPMQVVAVLDKTIGEMEHRYRLFSRLGVRNLAGYTTLRSSQRPDLDPLPHIVLIIDELADLMIVAPDEVERQICRLAQLARATGIHLVVATQRPSVDVITGLIKANIPTRIAFMVSSGVDSRTILDSVGAEHLLGKGDMLFLASDVAKGERIQGAYVADDEVERLAHFWRSQWQSQRQTLPQWTITPADDNSSLASEA